MRLTLRTLLAYMDDILEPQDHEELEKRIEASDFAHDLIHRTRDTMRRLRLTAPAVKGEGMGLDPNTVAEYLDNTLAADQVADFERVCLESDVHLAEVASCHHVLTMVLGEPAEIDPDVRRRMYALPARGTSSLGGGETKLRIEPAHVAPLPLPLPEPATQNTTVVVSPATVAAPVHRVEVPDYLRAAESSLLGRLVPAIAAVLVLSTVAYLAFRPNGWLREDSRLAQNETQPAAPPVADAPTVPAGDDSLAAPPTPPAEEAPLLFDGAGSLDEAGSFGEADTPTEQPDITVIESDTVIVAPPSDATDAVALPREPLDGTSLDESGDVPPPSAPTLPDVSPEGTVATPSPLGEEPIVEDSTPLPPLPPEPPGEAGTPDSVAALPSTGEIPGEMPIDPQPPLEVDSDGTPRPSPLAPRPSPQPAGPPVLGTFPSARQVLLRLEPDGAWRRVPPRARISAGSELLALPTYRPMVTLATGLNAELLGGTLLRLDAADPISEAAPVPHLTLVYGQVLLMNTGMAELTVPVQIGEMAATVRLQPNATLAIEVDRLFLPGSDPATDPAPVVGALYAPAGGVVWQSADATLEVPDPGMWQLAGDSVGPVEPYVATAWIDGEALNYWQQMSSPAIERMLTTDQPVGTQLLGLFRSTKRKEEKALLTECSMHVGQFVPFVKSLNDSDQLPEWDSQIDSLREAMARSPELAQRVRETMVVERGADKAPDLYRLLCGFSPTQVGQTPEEIQTGALRQLIDWLESDQLDYRVLAFRNLKDLTGKQLNYSPASTLDNRARSVRVWRMRLNDNELISAP